jgi:hypothetical protein
LVKVSDIIGGMATVESTLDQDTLLRYSVFLVTDRKIFGRIERVLKILPINMSHTR